ncbi:hypothetical protein ANCDUO_03303 [Ancylostoma duodenale]|uniref:TIL domain-containing protein n=1 Tax=Ancylostoma duodenale TaxID=51022 RepID=A0A0C2HA67_9BILA|nr:hypothetical protein ANCDUO_03303 [Ancylostoma duodenale]
MECVLFACECKAGYILDDYHGKCIRLSECKKDASTNQHVFQGVRAKKAITAIHLGYARTTACQNHARIRMLSENPAERTPTANQPANMETTRYT